MSFQLLKDNIVRMMNSRGEQDRVILIAAPEGGGKSTLMLHLVDYIDSKRGFQTPMKHVALSLEEFLRAWAKCNKNDVLVLDESKELEGVNYQDKYVRKFGETMTKLRKEGNIYIINVTNPFKLIRYLREDKISMVLYVWGRRNFKYFSKQDFARIMLNLNKEYKSHHQLKTGKMRGGFQGTFPNYEGARLQEYLDKKDKCIKDSKAELLDFIGDEIPDDVPKEKIYNKKQAYKTFGISPQFISEAIVNGTLPAQINKTGRSYEIKESDLENFAKIRKEKNLQLQRFALLRHSPSEKGKKTDDNTTGGVSL